MNGSAFVRAEIAVTGGFAFALDGVIEAHHSVSIRTLKASNRDTSGRAI